MLEFDEDTTRVLDIAYRGADITRRRQASFDALRPRAGERIVDIGCGNGLLTLELARATGDGGKVFGIDPSKDMRTLARQRCAAFGNVQIADGSASALPVPDGELDAAVSIQVFEYLDDLEAAAREAYRALKPGGRLVIGDMHWDTLAWHSDDRERMATIIEAWDKHLQHRCIPAIMPDILRRAEFAVESVTPFTIADTSLKPDGLANMLIHLIEPYVVNSGLASAAQAKAWAQEQTSLAEAGRFFFSLGHFVISARKV